MKLNNRFVINISKFIIPCTGTIVTNAATTNSNRAFTAKEEVRFGRAWSPADHMTSAARETAVIILGFSIISTDHRYRK